MAHITEIRRVREKYLRFKTDTLYEACKNDNIAVITAFETEMDTCKDCVFIDACVLGSLGIIMKLYPICHSCLDIGFIQALTAKKIISCRFLAFLGYVPNSMTLALAKEWAPDVETLEYIATC